jgi:NAD+ diphosphatase
MRDAEAVTFGGGRIDRASQLRADPEAQAALAADPRALGLALWRGRPLLETSPQAVRLGWMPLGGPVFRDATETSVFLGLDAGVPLFARVVPDWDGAVAASEGFADTSRSRPPWLPDAFGFGELRAVMAELDASEAGAAAAAKGILGWHATHRFCANCGAPSEVTDAGWRRSCPECRAQHFPRTDPVVIMVIVHGNSILLGRHAAWPPGMFSLLAGFMEPGETIEAAVRRETFEETAIPVGEVRYLASQPWPFPSSLMIGCHGVALAREIRRDPAEIEDARWVTREGMVAAFAGLDPELRPARPGSIARFLIERWLADDLD